jgi:hypothetical protein
MLPERRRFLGKGWEWDECEELGVRTLAESRSDSESSE